MKIYFEDGELEEYDEIGEWFFVKEEEHVIKLIKPIHYVIDAKYGYTNNANKFIDIENEDNTAIVYTNSLLALNNRLAWNEDLKVPEIYLRIGSAFERIDKLTNRELKQGHDIMKMYIAGEFEV